MASIKELRELMAHKARHKSTRINSFSREQPIDWAPQRITNPKSGYPFSDESAWDLIADLLDGDQELETIILESPPGKEAIVIKYPLSSDEVLYIKIHMGARDKVIGRSFHISTHF